MKTRLKVKVLSLALLMSCTQLSAADWLMLQGVEPETISPNGVKVPNNKTPKVWGFIQANYKKDYGSIQTKDGINQTPFSMLNPNLESQSGFNVARARIAIRGVADNDNKVNYFLMTDFGNNAINNAAGHKDVASYITDASITLKHVPYAKLRVGKFKYPGSEEGMQAVFFSPYIEFTTMANQQLLERHVSTVEDQEKKESGGADTTHYLSAGDENPIGAFRDTGAQVFDTVNISDNWAVSYAYMLGNGSGISNSSSDDRLTHYGYAAIQESFGGGKGFYTKSMKFFAWGQTGKRKLYSEAGDHIVSATRNRYGVGATYYNHGLRLEAEYIHAAGMIFTGAKDTLVSGASNEWRFQFAQGRENVADGGYINAQYEIIPQKLEIFGRFDYLDRLSNDKLAQRKFQTTTLGTSYRFQGPNRIDFNYAIRSAKAPGNADAQKVLDNHGNRLQVQITAVF